METQINRLRRGFSKLKEHQYLHGKLADSPECECGQEAETTRHYLLDCTKYSEEWTILIDTIKTLYVDNDIPPAHRTLDMVTLLKFIKWVPAGRFSAAVSSILYQSSI